VKCFLVGVGILHFHVSFAYDAKRHVPVHFCRSILAKKNARNANCKMLLKTKIVAIMMLSATKSSRNGTRVALDIHTCLAAWLLVVFGKLPDFAFHGCKPETAKQEVDIVQMWFVSIYG